MLRRPLTSTLFPYTTLFRSSLDSTARVIIGSSQSVTGRGETFFRPDQKNCSLAPLLGAVYRDRKSTRLNSSHVEISYAVFCLKKKRKEDSARRRRLLMILTT